MSDDVILVWKAKELRAAVLAQISENAETVGQFVEVEARRRLDAIGTPDNRKAVAWRRFLSRYVLTNTVATGRNEVVIRVGMKVGRGKGGDRRGFYVETGSSIAPAHPFLRPAVFGHAKEILQLLTGGK